MSFGTAPFGTTAFGTPPAGAARPALQLYRRAGTGTPSSLSFGEPAFSDGEPRLYVGNSDGSISTFVDKAYIDAATAPQPGARVYSDTALVVAANTIVPIPFNQERHDANGWHDNATNNTRITVSVAGTYHIGAHVYIYPDVPNAPGIVQLYLRVRTSGGAIRWPASHSVEVTGAYAGAGDFFATMSINSVHQLAANEYAEVWIANLTAGNVTVQNYGGANPGRFQYFQDFFVQRLTSY